MGRVVAAHSATETAVRRALPPLWLVWLGVAAFMMLVAWQAIITYSTQDPDDTMRLLQVRDWVAGQGWYDTRQYRLDPPYGADMHWVRLVDLPIAFFLVMFEPFMAQRTAESAAMTVVPLIQLFLTMLLMRATMRRIGASEVSQIAAAALVPAFPLLLTNFVPTRIDHHGWQAFCALAMAWGLVGDRRRDALVAGVAAACLLMISLEGIALCAVVGGLFAIRYWLWGKRQHEMFLAGLGVALPVLFVIFRPLSELGRALCDLPTWPHFLAFGGGAAVAALSRVLPGQQRAVGRLLSLVPVGAAVATALFVPLGRCVISPLKLDPYLKVNWFDNMAESASLPHQTVSIAAMTLWTVGLAIIGGIAAWRSAPDPDLRMRRGFLAVTALGAGAVSMLIMRAGLTAQLLTLPFAAMLIVQKWPAVRGIRPAVPRVVATLALIGLATPLLVSAITKRFDRTSALTQAQVPSAFAASDCDVDRLNAIPKSRMFATIDRGPELLVRTPHSAVMSGYHRNQAKMIEVIKGFAGTIEESRAIIHRNRSDYVVACTSSPDLWVAANAGADNLADRIIAGRVPDWLAPVPGFDQGALRLYKVR